MSEIITSTNIDRVIQMNKEIAEEVTSQALKIQTNPTFMVVNSVPQLALFILQGFGLIQMPIDDEYWSGAIFVKEDKRIPVINTAMPRANQYFTAWHEVYHLLFDKLSFDHVIESDNTIEERKAELFAARMLLRGVDRYFADLSPMDFISRVMCCMSAFQAPYKAVLISLYEDAVQRENQKMQEQIREVLDLKIENMPQRFRKMGLDVSLLESSYVINTTYLQEHIDRSEEEFPELDYHKENDEYLKNLVNEIRIITEGFETT